MTNNTKILPPSGISPGDHVKKFRDAEHLWFWFMSCRQKDTMAALSFKQMRMRTLTHNPYSCEALDVETLITRLFLAGKLNDGHLQVLKEFGDRRRAPNQHVWAENARAALWSSAMRVIASAASEKGWME
ncbi:MAG: hypothetical protein FWF97_00835 [Alphaproteobacteria bacterium]|nr:hypothetical protein [Alphaproteobacteria bacterium]